MNKEYKDMINLWSGKIKDIKPHAHWKEGLGEEYFNYLGDVQFQHLKYFIEKHNIHNIFNIMEYGSGGGCNGRLLCKEFNHFFAVDISEPNLKEFAKQMKLFYNDNFTLIHYDGNNPDTLGDQIRNIDFIFSTAVFQHLPSLDYSLKVLKNFNRMLINNGHICIQYRENPYPDKPRKNTEYLKNYIRMLTFTDNEIKEQLKQSNFELLELKKFNKLSKTYKWVLGRKK